MSKKTDAQPANRLQLNVRGQAGESSVQAVTRTLSDPNIQAASAIARWQGAMPDVNVLAEHLQAQAKQVQGGNLAQAEAMLMAQASTLDAVFNTLMQQCAESQAMKLFEVRMRLGLKAQAQCRNTIEALAEIKNPRPVLIAKQANVSHGPQQVNNGVQQAGLAAPGSSTRERAPARENEGAQNRLLEQTHAERLDFGATGTAGRTHPHLAAVGAVHRTED